jgi:predicted nucleic acid-binding protein
VRDLIFDASSTYLLIKRKALHDLMNSQTLDLAFYEIGNSIVQERKMNIIDENAAKISSEVLGTLPEVMDVKRFHDLSSEKILDIAAGSKLTFYDASYLALAKTSNDVLVTEDEALARAARKSGIKVYTSENYQESQLSQ